MEIIKMKMEHYNDVFDMMKTFYSSDAVYTNGSEEIFRNDILQCISDNPFVEGYIFINEEIMGYGMIARSFSTEFSKQCIWIEDLYIKEKYRHQGIGTMFLEFIKKEFSDCLIRLEIEEENVHALKAYKKSGFTLLPYQEMMYNK